MLQHNNAQQETANQAVGNPQRHRWRSRNAQPSSQDFKLFIPSNALSSDSERNHDEDQRFTFPNECLPIQPAH